MRAAIIYVSVHHRNTERIAKRIAGVLGADIFDLEKIRPDLSEYDIIGFGSGIYFWKHHKSLIEFVRSLPRIKKKAFVFSTAGIPLRRNHKILKDILKDKGFEIIGEFSCRGYDTFSILRYIGGINRGRPNDRDMEKARTFAERLKTLV